MALKLHIGVLRLLGKDFEKMVENQKVPSNALHLVCEIHKIHKNLQKPCLNNKTYA